ncbi:MAG: IS1595 family transposase [Actinomycetota bacterium]
MSEFNILQIAERIPDEAAAYEYLEELRWNGSPVCPHCGNEDRCYFLKPANGKSRATRTGKQTQRRLWKCGACRKQFSVLTDTVMHGTKIPVRVWVFVIFEMCASKNGVSAREIERKYGVCPRSAWFLTQRIREAMKDNGLSMFTGTIVADETFIGGKAKNMHRRERDRRITGTGGVDKAAVLSLVNTGTGEVRSKVVPDVTGHTLRKAIADQVSMADSVLHTDSALHYNTVGREFIEHQAVNHDAGEYVRGDVTTNQAEGYFSQLKRSLDGTHHHVSREHLGRYLAEFDYRYSTRESTDDERVDDLLKRVGGRRLAYKPLIERASAS